MYEFEELVQKCEKEYAFKILQKSSFFVKIIKDDKENYNDNIKNKIEYKKIIIHDEEEINIDLVKNLRVENEPLKKIYKKFLSILNEIENKFKSEINNNIDIEVKFENKNKNLKLNFVFFINCLYSFHSPVESKKFSFKDENILVNGLNNGINYALNEINSLENEDNY